MAIPFCLSTGYVVPHEYNGKEFRFWRIPVECPLEGDHLVKSEKKAAHKHHVVKQLDEVIWK